MGYFKSRGVHNFYPPSKWSGEDLLYQSSLGVIQDLEIQSVHKHLQSGDFVIMITDGIMDALPVGEQEFLLDTIIRGTSLNNPKEMAHHILEQVLEWTGEEPMDDMTVLVVGIWRI